MFIAVATILFNAHFLNFREIRPGGEQLLCIMMSRERSINFSSGSEGASSSTGQQGKALDEDLSYSLDEVSLVH